MWKLTADSGAYMLNVGVESVVNDIRQHIKKKFNNDDLEYNLKMAKRYKINLKTIRNYNKHISKHKYLKPGTRLRVK